MTSTPSAGDEGDEREPHVILYFDVNKTVIMHDPVQGKNLEHILNDLLTERAFGSVAKVASTGDATWTWNGRRVFTDGDGFEDEDEHVSYGSFLRSQYPMSSDPAIAKRNKTLRKVLRQDFTAPGNAGEALALEHQALLQKLQLPAGTDDEQQSAKRAQAGLADAQHFFIVPAFFRLLQHLHARGMRFNLVFRTYGDDLARIAQEFNCFCEGMHPIFSLQDTGGVRMDGSDGGIDRRIHLSSHRPLHAADAGEAHHRFGTFFRSDELTALVMGTFRQPKESHDTPDLSFYEDVSSSSPSPEPVLQVYSGIPAIHEFLTNQWREQQATLAIRDFYPFWFRNCEDARTGKLMTIDPRDDGVHVLFFDDNILAHEPHIVDARHARDGSALDFAATTKDVHLMRVEPLEAIQNDSFFIERFHASLENRKKQRRFASRA